MFDLEPTADIGDAIANLRRDGIAVLRGYLDQQRLDLLRDEFERAFDTEDSGVYARHYHPTSGRVARAKPDQLSDEEFGNVRSIFRSDRFEKITKEYYYPNRYRLNDDVFFSHELPSGVPILPWHFDRQQALKFFMYLVDTNEENGAFEYCPGTQREGRLRANYHVLRGGRQRDIPNDIPDEEIRNPVTVAGKAGDLIIFDPDGFHRGGVVQEGNERKIIRGHAHPVPAPSDGRFRMSALIAWLYRAMSPLGARVERRVGDQVVSDAARTRSDQHVSLVKSTGEQK
jgi:hypothetical protein